MADLQSAALATWPRSHIRSVIVYRINGLGCCIVPTKLNSQFLTGHAGFSVWITIGIPLHSLLVFMLNSL